MSVTNGLLTPLYGGVSELGIESCLLGTAYVLSPLISLKLFSLNTGVDDSPASYKKGRKGLINVVVSLFDRTDSGKTTNHFSGI